MVSLFFLAALNKLKSESIPSATLLRSPAFKLKLTFLLSGNHPSFLSVSINISAAFLFVSLPTICPALLLPQYRLLGKDNHSRHP